MISLILLLLASEPATCATDCTGTCTKAGTCIQADGFVEPPYYNASKEARREYLVLQQRQVKGFKSIAFQADEPEARCQFTAGNCLMPTFMDSAIVTYENGKIVLYEWINKTAWVQHEKNYVVVDSLQGQHKIQEPKKGSKQ